MPAIPFLPIFNLEVAIWRSSSDPDGEADLLLEAQLYWPSKGLLDIQPGTDAFWQPPLYLRVPKRSDVRLGDRVECPEGTGRIYRVRFVDDMHRGFANEYRAAILEQVSMPVPLP